MKLILQCSWDGMKRVFEKTFQLSNKFHNLNPEFKISVDKKK